VSQTSSVAARSKPTRRIMSIVGDAGWQSAHPELAARADDPHIQAMAQACGMDVESFLMEQFAAGLDGSEQQQSGECCNLPHRAHCLAYFLPLSPFTALNIADLLSTLLRAVPVEQPRKQKASRQQATQQLLPAHDGAATSSGAKPAETPPIAKRKRAAPAAKGGGSAARGRKKEPVPTLPEIAAGFRLLQPDGGKRLRKSSVIQVALQPSIFGSSSCLIGLACRAYTAHDASKEAAI